MGDRKQSLVFVRAEYAPLLCAALPGSYVCVKNTAEFRSALKEHKPAVAFVDFDLFSHIEDDTDKIKIVGIVDDSLAEAVRSFSTFPWLSHLITTAMLATPLAPSDLAMLLERLEHGHEPHVLGAAGIGRVALLGASTRREARFERMREFYTSQGVSARTVAAISDIAEELVTNALYDAPVEAGYFKHAVQRTEDVELPPEHACEISYGIAEGSVFVRVRDPFGALTRTRLLNVLGRCNASDVALDESRGGAGLGLWRVFSNASTIAITVTPGTLTDILVRVEMKRSRANKKPVLAVHMFFPTDQAIAGALGRFAADHDSDLLDESITVLRVA